MHKNRFYLCVDGNHFEFKGQVIIIVHMHKNRFYLCVDGNHFEFKGQVILIEKHETYIFQFQIMQKPEIVQ